MGRHWCGRCESSSTSNFPLNSTTVSKMRSIRLRNRLDGLRLRRLLDALVNFRIPRSLEVALCRVSFEVRAALGPPESGKRHSDTAGLVLVRLGEFAKMLRFFAKTVFGVTRGTMKAPLLTRGDQCSYEPFRSVHPASDRNQPFDGRDRAVWSACPPDRCRSADSALP